MLTDIIVEILGFPNSTFTEDEKLKTALERYSETSGENPLRCVRDLSMSMSSATELNRVKFVWCKKILVDSRRGQYG